MRNKASANNMIDDGDGGSVGGGWWLDQSVSDGQRIRQRRLVLLHHAAKCTSAEGRCRISHCSEMKRVWKHIATCKKGNTCDFPHCHYSRFVLSHYRRCKDRSCVVCGPVREMDKTQNPNKKRTASAAGFRQDLASYCRLCLQQGPSALGDQPVRDCSICSCVSNTGFTHLSCIVASAENKSRQASTWDRMMVTRRSFKTCPSCNEDYRNYVRCDLLKARVLFVEREFKTDHMLYLHAMVDRMGVLVGEKSEQDRAEGEEMCFKMVSVIEEIRRTNTQSNAFMRNVATAYSVMGCFSLRRADEFHEKSREIMQELDNDGIEPLPRK
jgi:hypothetical protein